MIYFSGSSLLKIQPQKMAQIFGSKKNIVRISKEEANVNDEMAEGPT